MSTETKERFEKLVRVYENDVYRIILNIVNDHHTAQDLTQNVMLNAWKGFHTLREPDKSKAWVKSIAGNVLKEHMRRKKAYLDMVELRDMDNVTDGELKAMETDILRAIVKKEEKQIVVKAIKELNPTYQKIVREHLLGGITLKDIAKHYEMNYGTVRVYYSKAIKLIKEICERLLKGGELNG